MPAPQPTIAELRETLRTLGGSKGRGHLVASFGVPAIDLKLAEGGLQVDALHEAAAEGESWGDDAAVTLFLASIAARSQGPVLWVIRTRDLFAPALYQVGLDPARVLYAEARDDAELLALMEEGLRHGGLGAVVGEARRVPMAATRRLQLAGEGGSTIALLLRRPSCAGVDPFASPSAAVTRWRVSSAPSAPVPWRGIGHPRWSLSCVRQRGGNPFDLVVEAPDETACLTLPAELVDRPVAERSAPARAAG